MQQYSFITRWKIKAPLQEVWDAIYLSEEWPVWWKGVVAVKEIKEGDVNGIGSIRVYKLRSPMFYTLRFNLLLTDRIDMQLLKGDVSGELTGTGAWHFKEEKGISAIECYWHVATTVKWMNMFAFILKPLFRYNHAVVMKWGAESLAHKLNAELISVSHS